MSVEVSVLPGGRLGTAHVTVSRTSSPTELDLISAEYAAIAAHIRATTPADPAEVDAIEAVVVAASTPEPAADARTAAERFYQGGLRRIEV